VATYNDGPVLIKFCQNYHGNAHRIIAKAGYAPQLFFCKRLLGGVVMVIVELVNGRDAFHHFGSTKTIPSTVLDNVKAAISILHSTNFVFGDMRRPNILVKK
jgi:tRNA A-37 threonylcarbamoyl transferase component Bud32